MCICVMFCTLTYLQTGKRVALPEDEDSDLDLKKELKPISAYVKNRPVMIDEMFRAVRGASLQRALPDLLKVKCCSFTRA